MKAHAHDMLLTQNFMEKVSLVPQLNSIELGFFRLVADAGSIAAAAVAGGWDASTISRRISQLEKSVGTRLFSRSGRGVKLTPQGEILLNYARQIGTLIDSAVAEISITSQSGPARIRIAAQPTIAKVMFGELFHAIHDRYPACQIHFTEALANKILTDLQSGEIDIAIIYRPESPNSLSYEPLLFEQLHLLTPMDSEVSAEQVRATELDGIPLILPSTHHGLRVLVQNMAAKRGYVANIVLECDSSTSVTLDLVKKKCGCTIKPLVGAEADIAAGLLRGIPLEGSEFERCVALVLGKTHISAGDLWVLNSLIRRIATQMVQNQTWSGTRLA
jgi:LysR family transcriptional regulator, nitrogen assimilation regulatory protein